MEEEEEEEEEEGNYHNTTQHKAQSVKSNDTNREGDPAELADMFLINLTSKRVEALFVPAE